MKITFEETVKRVAAINATLHEKNFTDQEIDEFWTNTLKLIPRIIEVGVKNIKVCTGCGHLNIEPLEKGKHYCCPDNNYIPIKTDN